jgi:hypothetical protein
VSLALIALLVVTGGADPSTRHGRQLADASTGDKQRQSSDGTTPSSHRSPAHSLALAPTTTSTTVATSSHATQHTDTSVPLLATSGTGSSAGAPAPATPTTTVSPTTTAPSTGAGNSQSADRIQAPGVLDPPASTSHSYSFTGTGAMQVSVVWSGNTYLTLVVSCPNGSQTVGGTSAMAANLPNALGACMATVTEPATESVALSYTITIGPTGA